MPDNQSEDAGNVDRREFLAASAAAGIAAALGSVVRSATAADARGPGEARSSQFKVPPIDPVRVGFVGVGGMGSNHVRNFLQIEGVQIKAACDTVESKVTRIQNLVEKAGQPRPAGYSRGEHDFKRLCEQEDLDLVVTATPWRWHVPVCVAAMENGKHAATEVPAAITLDGCWQLVETAEKANRHCVMLENCCYDRIELMVLNMVRKGLLGELLHAECGYLHDLRALKFSGRGEGLWRLAHSVKRDADLYPTHGLGPIAQCMNINRGNQFDHLVSMSCNSRGLNLFAAKKSGPDSAQAKQTYASGDVVTTLIRTALGQTIIVKHDTNTPRPYSRGILVQGTKGIVRKYPRGLIHVEGRTRGHDWEPLSSYLKEFEHPLWPSLREKSKGKGHGGMDYVEDYRLVRCLRTGAAMDMDVYDAAAWSAVVELSERSIASRSTSVAFPDFTRGKWKSNPPLGIVTA